MNPCPESASEPRSGRELSGLSQLRLHRNRHGAQLWVTRMTRFRIHVLSEEKREAFRQRSPKKPPYQLARSNYKDGPVVSAKTPYDLWSAQRDGADDERANAANPPGVGDAVESSDGLLICNYWGFDPAEWRVSRIREGGCEDP